MSDISKTLKRLIHDFRGFAKDEEVAKINKAVVQMANNSNLGVAEDGIEELLKERGVVGTGTGTPS